MALKTSLNFVTPGTDGDVRFVLDNGWTGTDQQTVDLAVHDLREQAPPKLETDGFCLTRIDCRVTDFDDEAQVMARWSPALKQAVMDQTGARWVSLFAGPLRRFSNNHPRSFGSSVSAPARAVHADLHGNFSFFDISSQPVAEQATREARQAFGSTAPQRWAVYNIWQMLSHPPQDNSLAFCRLPTVADDDIITGKGYFDEPGKSPRELIADRADNHDFDITFFRHNSRQEWCYFSNLTPGDAVIFSAFYPGAGKLKARTPHAAIDLPSAGDISHPRQSVEIRALVAW